MHILAVCFAIARVILTLSGLKASRNLHNPVLQQVLRSPMSFFDSTPIGRILNRFGREIEIVDMQLPINFRFFMQCITHVATTIIAITVSTPIFLVVCAVLIALYIYLLVII
jgi:ABC-type multidrug transport system fused ATPase/permease subunit